jgi:hypothetical protein
MRHGLFWAATLGTNFLMQLPAHFAIGTDLYVGGLFFNQLPASLLAIYPLLYGVLPRLMRQKQLPLFLVLLAGWLLATVVLTNLTRSFYDLVIVPNVFGVMPSWVYDWTDLTYLSYTWWVLIITAGAASAIKVMNGWYEQRQHQQELLQRKLQTELELLKAQLQPTFLFDTLRTLHKLTTQKSAESPGAVLHLAELLRYMLYESACDVVPLADEVAMIRHYVALEQLRLKGRVEVSLSFSGNFEHHAIAPLLLLPFVENAFRYGTEPQLECAWISIDLVAKANSLTFKVINSQLDTCADWHEGTGLRSIRQRLARLYDSRHELKIVSEPDSFLVALHLRPSPPPLTTVPTTIAEPLRARFSTTDT